MSVVTGESGCIFNTLPTIGLIKQVRYRCCLISQYPFPYIHYRL